MSVRMAPPLPVILLLMFPEVSGGGDWGVTYISSHICALEGSSVIIPCTYTYPPGHQVKNVFWNKTTLGTGREPPNLLNDPEYRQRIQYLGDKHHNCTIRLTHVKQADSHKYYFGFTTNITGGKYTGAPEITLNVTDLQVETSKKVKEGDSVTLKCKTICRLTDTSTFIWYRNIKSLRQRKDVNNDKLVLRSVRREDAGIYSCRVQGHNLTSPEYRLNVMYPPEKTLAVVSPSGEIVEGDSVTLTCSSDANPPVHTHTWFKENSSIGSVNIYRIKSIRSDHGGEYKCKVSNDYGMKYSNALILNVMYPPRNVSISISSSGVIVEGDSVTLTCSSESNPPVHIYSWFKGKKSVGSGNIYSITSIRSDHSGEYKCKTKNKHGEKYSEAVMLNVMYAPRDVSASISSSGVIVEGDPVTLTCSSESNPPVHNYSWFKENQTSSVGSGQGFRPLESGWFYCVSQNKHGSQRSAAVLVIFDGGQNVLLYTFAGVISVLGCLFFIFIVLFLCKTKKQRSNNNGGEQENDSTYQDMSKRHDDHRENIYTKCISESICESPPDVDCNDDIYQNLDPEDKSHEDVYVTADVPDDNQSDDTYVNTDMCRTFE